MFCALSVERKVTTRITVATKIDLEIVGGWSAKDGTGAGMTSAQLGLLCLFDASCCIMECHLLSNTGFLHTIDLAYCVRTKENSGRRLDHNW